MLQVTATAKSWFSELKGGKSVFEVKCSFIFYCRDAEQFGKIHTTYSFFTVFRSRKFTTNCMLWASLATLLSYVHHFSILQSSFSHCLVYLTTSRPSASSPFLLPSGLHMFRHSFLNTFNSSFVFLAIIMRTFKNIPKLWYSFRSFYLSCSFLFHILCIMVLHFFLSIPSLFCRIFLA